MNTINVNVGFAWLTNGHLSHFEVADVTRLDLNIGYCPLFGDC